MIDTTPESLAAMAAQALPQEPPPTEGQIDDFLARMTVAFQLPENLIAEARKLIHARFAIRMDKGETLTSEDDHAPWLDMRRASIDPFYWTRYREASGWERLATSGGSDTGPCHRRAAGSPRQPRGGRGLETAWPRHGGRAVWQDGDVCGARM